MTDLTTGEASTYVSTEDPLSEEDVARANIRTMDCMDCHDRPTHIFRSPSYAVNLALETGKIDATLPFIKRTGVELLAKEYDSTDAALDAIKDGVTKFYQDKYPDVLRTRADAIADAVAALQEIYRLNFFPRMKVRWDVYADNIGHLLSSGCYRCHDGLHTSGRRENHHQGLSGLSHDSGAGQAPAASSRVLIRAGVGWHSNTPRTSAAPGKR